MLSYKFIDDDFDISVICQLDEAVPLGQVRAAAAAPGFGAAPATPAPQQYRTLLKIVPEVLT